MKEFYALAGALLAAISTIPYLVDIVRHKTKPNVVTWLTWTILTLIAGSAALAAGEGRTALFLYGNSVCTGAVVVFGLVYHGIAKFSPFDIICQIGAVVGLVCWLVFDSPTIGIIVPVIIDFLGVMPTVRHAYLKPGEETWQTFMIGVFAPALTILSLTEYNVASLLFPFYILAMNILIVSVVVTRRQQLGLALSR